MYHFLYVIVEDESAHPRWIAGMYHMVAAVACRIALMTVRVVALACVALAVALMLALVAAAVVPALPPAAQVSYHSAHKIEPMHLAVSRMMNKICNSIRSVLPLCINEQNIKPTMYIVKSYQIG